MSLLYRCWNKISLDHDRLEMFFNNTILTTPHTSQLINDNAARNVFKIK